MATALLFSQPPLWDKGGREENQDFYKIREWNETTPALFQFIVADGLGGQGGGKLVSEAATLKMLQPPTTQHPEHFSREALTLQFNLAHQHIKKLQQAGKPEFSRMATTLVTLLIKDNQALWGHVGDSRLYLFREGKLYHQTKDHSVPQMQVSSGEISAADIRHHPDRNRLLRALGDHSETIQAKIHSVETLQAGDVFLLCSDGFWEYVTENAMLNSLHEASSPTEWLTLMENQYLKPAVEKERQHTAKETADNDNYTAIAVWYGETPLTTWNTAMSMIKKAWNAL